MDATEKLARFVLETPYRSFPADVCHQAKRCFIDLIGVTLGGCKQPLSKILIEMIPEFDGKHQSTVLGWGLKTNVMNAALINGSMAHALDYDDVHLGAHGHPSAPLIPAILALGEWKKISGQAALEAFVLGYEVETRIGVGIGFGHYERGWHSTSTFGRFGAAVAAGKLLGLSLDQMLYAMGLAGTQASGVRLVFGTMAKPFHAGKSASDGVMSALMAERNFTCARNILEGKKGYVEALGEGASLDRMVQDLGKVYEIRNNTFKINASCLLTHPIIDAVRELRNRNDLRMEHIQEIQCEVSKLCLDTAGNEDPQTGLAGKFSTHFCAALALAEGFAGEEMFTDAKVLNPDMVALRKKVKVKIAPELKETEAKACITALNGQQYSTFVHYPKGDPRNPLTDQELEEKFRSLAAVALPKEKMESLLKAIWGLGKVRDIGKVIKLCS